MRASSIKSELRLLIIPSVAMVIALCTGAAPAFAQGPGGATFARPENLSWGVSELGGLRQDQRDYAVAGRVMNLEGDVIRDASVQISPLAAGEFRYFKTDASGDFQTFYRLARGSIPDFKVWLTVKKSGFQTAHELIDYADFAGPVRLPITLRPDEQDTDVLPQQDLVAHLLPELKSVGTAQGLAAKSEKQYAKGVQEFAGKRRPERALNDFQEVVRRNPGCAKCLTMLALAELDSGDWDSAARNMNAAAQMTLKDKAVGSTGALLLGGVMESWMHKPQEATNFLARADQLDPGDPLVLQEIGRAQLQLQQFEMADAYLERALKAGAGPEARLLRVRALLGEDDLQTASLEMKRYLNGRKPKTFPVQVRRIWAMVQNGEEIRKIYSGPEKSRHGRRAVERVDYLDYSAAQLPGLEPAKDQSQLKSILAAVGKNVASLFHDFQNSTSVEEIHQEKIGRKGNVSSSLEHKFHYLCLLPSDASVPGFTEYRKSIDQVEGQPGGLDQGYMLTSGFASAALVFHPVFQAGSKFRYLGKQMIDGRETYVVAFAQIPAKAELRGRFKSGNKSAPTFQQGLAWIDTQNDQILRLRTDLLRPLPELRLSEETTQIDFQDVHFKKIAEGFWLPRNVTVTVDWRGKKLRNLHQYSDYRLFNVTQSETIKAPKRPQESSKTSPDSSTQKQ